MAAVCLIVRKNRLYTTPYPYISGLGIITCMNMDRQKIIMVSVSVAVVLGAIAAYYYLENKKSAESAASSAQSATDAASQGVLPSIGEAANPLSNKPDINPTSKTNPFDSVKTNPFQ